MTVAKTQHQSLQPMLVQKLTGSVGAMVTGVDLSLGIDDETFAEIKTAFLAHGMLCIRGQGAMTPADQLAFASRWGEVWVHPYVSSIEGHPGIMKIYDPHPISQTWHADSTYSATPPGITLLLARTLPPLGGDTMWTSTCAAYNGLSVGLRQVLGSLRAVHQGTTSMANDVGLSANEVTATHPVLRRHPETGQLALFVNGNYTRRFEGWSDEESAPLLHFLYSQIGRPEHTYRHRWAVGDLVIWDNRCTQHAVIGDTDGAERVLHRVTIVGDVPR